MKTIPMKKLLTSLLAALTGMLLLMTLCHAASGSAGKEFYVAFPPNLTMLSSPGNLSVFITGPKDTQGTVDVDGLDFHTTFTVQANKVTAIALPKAAQALTARAVSKLGVHILAQDEVTVYGLNQESGSTDGYLALPVNALGMEYYALTYTGLGSSSPAQIALVAPFDNTQVTITPSKAFAATLDGTPFTITLNRGETYLVTNGNEVTGTRILASAPIGVLCGVDAAHIPTYAEALDHIVEMMPPVSTWGKTFLTVPLATRLNGDFFRVVASEDGTKVTINGVLVATLERGAFFETVLKTRSRIDTSAPALLAQFSAGTSFDGVNGDPFAMMIPPAEQFLSKYTFSTPAQGFPNSFVNVVVPSGAVANLQLDGVAVDTSHFSPIGDSGFSGGQLPIGAGTHNMDSGSDLSFGISVYGFGYHDGYGYPGGMSFKSINPVGDPYPPNLRLVPLGDVIQGTATDSEDVNANGVLDTGEDLNGNGKIDRRSEDLNGNGKLDAGEDGNANGVLDRDTGIFKVELLPGSSNIKLDVPPFVPGALAVQYSITRIDPTQPGNGTLHVEDGAGNKVESPLVIGAVAVLKDVRVVATLSNSGIEIDSATFKKQPYSITNGAKQQIIEWRFDTFSANSAADLGFDVLFKNPLAGEKRVLSQQVDLFYNDANGLAVHTALDGRSVDVASASFSAALSTDKSSYAAGDLVQIGSVVKNLGTSNGAVGVRLTVKDANDAVVAALGSLPIQAIGAGASVTFAGLNFAVANTYVGNYKIMAEVLDNGGAVLALAYVPLTIAPASGIGSGVKAAITTDKQSYSPQDKVLLSDRLSNVAVNQSLNELRIATTVRDAGGMVRFSKTETLPQLPAGNMKDYAYSLPLAFAAAGRYSATMLVSSADGTQLAQVATAFTVGSSADSGAGLTGKLVLSEKEVALGESLAFSVDAANAGNSALTNQAFKVSIVDVAAQKIVAEFSYLQTLNVGASYNAASNWIGAGLPGTHYAAVLTAVVGGKTLTLAQDSFTVVARPIKFDIKQTIPGGSRVLVLLSCQSIDGDEDDDEERHGGHGGGRDDDHRRARYCGDDGDEHDGRDGDHRAKLCLAQRAQAIKAALDALGVSYQIVQTVDGFRRALRSGYYNVYWISNAQYALGNTLARELREAIRHGDSLITDAGIGARNQILDDISGVQVTQVIGKQLPLTLNGSYFPSPATLPTQGRIVQLQALGGAKVQANFEVEDEHDQCDERDHHHDGEHCNHPCHSHEHDRGHEHGPDNDRCDGHGHEHCQDDGVKTRAVPGIVSNDYGAGHTLVFGFDLVDTLLTQASAWQDALQAGFGALAPATSAIAAPGAYLSVKTSVNNLANAVDIDVKTTLPAGVAYAASNPVGAYDARSRTVDWTFNLANDRSRDLLLTVQLQNAGTFNLPTLISTVKGGIATRYGDPLALALIVTGAAQTGADTVKALQALPLRQRQEQRLRDAIVSELKDTLYYFGRNKSRDYETVICNVIAMADALGGLATVDVTAIHAGLGSILKETQWRWTLLQPAPISPGPGQP